MYKCPNLAVHHVTGPSDLLIYTLKIGNADFQTFAPKMKTFHIIQKTQLYLDRVNKMHMFSLKNKINLFQSESIEIQSLYNKWKGLFE